MCRALGVPEPSQKPGVWFSLPCDNSAVCHWEMEQQSLAVKQAGGLIPSVSPLAVKLPACPSSLFVREMAAASLLPLGGALLVSESFKDGNGLMP